MTLQPGVRATWTTTTKFQTNAIECHFLQAVTAADFGEMNLLSRILTSGCQLYPHSEQLSAALATLYGADLQISNRPIGQWHDLTVRLSFVEPQEDDHNFTACLALLGEVIFHSLLTTPQAAQIFAVEKRALLSELRDLQTDNGFQAFSLTKSAFFQQTALSENLAAPAVGTIAEVQAVDLARLQDLYREILSQWPVEIGGLFRQTPAALTARLQTALPFCPRTTAIQQPMVVNTPQRPLQRVEQQIVGAQSRLCLAYSTDTPLQQAQWDQLLVLGQVLGGSEQSLLFQQVREQHGLVYDISAYFDFTMGWLLIDAGVTDSRLGQVQALVAAALTQIQQEQTPLSLLRLVQADLLKHREMVVDSPQRLLNRQLNQVIQPQRQRSDAQFTAAIQAITPATLAKSVTLLHLQVVTTLLGREEGQGHDDIKAD
ncbi:M16 family metallopeptidase [Lapidilactobacillus luobeiensis]|uniref:M16 family metallopeptidase n=1 Tax=Lapidilactobacillus luobeiensis TaxID=2950371 RepID=UPI0021C3DA92|nr:insulinase family protein [Lapidilactobacillus luobeiensis]